MPFVQPHVSVTRWLRPFLYELSLSLLSLATLMAAAVRPMAPPGVLLWGPSPPAWELGCPWGRGFKKEVIG